MTRTIPDRMTTGLLIALAFITASGPFATDLYLPGMPEVAVDLNTSASMTQLTLSAFMLGMALGQLFVGILSDATGRLRPMRIGAIVALISAIACSIAPNIGILIIARLFHGLGAGACLVIARAMVPDITKGKGAARAYTVLMMIQGIAPVFAPVVGGLLAEPIGWRGIFWVLTILVAAQVVIAYTLPETLPPEQRGSFNLAELTKTFTSVMSSRAFRWYTFSFAVGFGGFFAYISASSFVIQESWGFSPAVYSIIFACNAGGLILAGIISNRMLQTYSEYQITVAGLIIMLVAAIATMVFAVTDASNALRLICLFFAVAPLSLVVGNLTGLAVAEVPDNTGSASAVTGFFQFILAAIASPIVGLGTNENLTMGICMAVAYACSLLAVIVANKVSTQSAPHSANGDYS